MSLDNQEKQTEKDKSQKFTSTELSSYKTGNSFTDAILKSILTPGATPFLQVIDVLKFPY